MTLNEDEARELIRRYGLLPVATPQDDLRLWAEVLWLIWPLTRQQPFREGRCEVYFGFWAEPAGPKSGTHFGRRSYQEPNNLLYQPLGELWRLTGASAGNYIWEKATWPVWPGRFQQVQALARPTAGQSEAISSCVCEGGPGAGSGYTIKWLRQADGSWGRVKKYVGRWMR